LFTGVFGIGTPASTSNGPEATKRFGKRSWMEILLVIIGLRRN